MNESIIPLSGELLEKKIGYKFRDFDLLKKALMHSSYANEVKNKVKSVKNNERLEFLGDSVLSLIVSDYLFNKYRDFHEGDLTRIRAAVVCEGSLSSYAHMIELGKYMFLGHGEVLSNGRDRKSILADAFEALLAAIYIDGGMKAAAEFLLPFVVKTITDTVSAGNNDYKSRLQKIVQQTPEETLEYRMISEEGPAHDRIFTFSVYLNSNCLGTGTGHSKREAEQLAAKESLIMLGEE